MQYKLSDLTFSLAVYILVGVTVCHTFLGGSVCLTGIVKHSGLLRKL